MADPGVVIVNRGQYGELIAQGLRDSVPGETFVVAGPGDVVPGDAEILVTLGQDAEAVAALIRPTMRWVHILGAGVDGVPLDALAGRVVTCSRGAASTAIAEWVLATMLAFEKKLPDSFVHEPPPQWNMASLGGLAGRTLGLVGIGSIGSEVARRAQAFDMEVLAVRRTGAAGPGDVGIVGKLEELASRADHLVVCAPATQATFHVVDRSVLGACGGVHLVNIARGSLIDQEALRVALDDGSVALASLDTVDPEPLPAGHWLYVHPKVRLSPHISWSSATTMTRTIEIFVENLSRYRIGDALQGLVDLEAGY